MRASIVVVSVALLGLACGREPVGTQGAPSRSASGSASAQASADASGVAAAPSPEPPASTKPVDELGAAPAASADAAGEPGEPLEPGEPGEPAEPAELAAAELAEPADPLAPILPSGPEPGSPEADAELEALLEESTLTQDEFEAAFKGSKPKIDGDQLVWGAGERIRQGD